MIEHFAANDIELATHSSTFALQARDTLDGSITVRCPGTLTIHAAKKSFSGSTRMNRDHPDFPRGSFTTPVRIEFDHAAQGLHSAWQGMPYTVYADGARITEGVLDGSGSLLLDHSAATREYLVELANGVRYALPIDNAFADRGEDPLAEKIKVSVAAQLARGRDPAAHGAIHLFVLTNSSDAGIGAGTVNTYRMLQSLGRADALPGVARQERLDAIAAQRKALAARETQVQRQIKALDQQHSMVPVTNPAVARQRAERYAPLNRELEDIRAQQRALDEEEARLQGQGSLARQDDELKAARAQTTALEQERDTLRKRGADTTEIDQRLDQARGRERALQQAYDEELGQTIPPEDIPGLKCHLCTLVAPDTAAGEDWVEVYIHAKLMIVDDAYMTLGSSNINTRSMEVDTEINIAHDRPEVTRPARLQLWASHTNGNGAQVDTEVAFEQWGWIMELNATLRKTLSSPIAQLAPFLCTSEERKASD